MDIQAVLREFCRNETMLDGFDLPDALAMAIAIEPTIVTREAHHFVDVISGDGPARGQTIVDERGHRGREPNCRVIYEVCLFSKSPTPPDQRGPRMPSPD